MFGPKLLRVQACAHDVPNSGQQTRKKLAWPLLGPKMGQRWAKERCDAPTGTRRRRTYALYVLRSRFSRRVEISLRRVEAWW